MREIHTSHNANKNESQYFFHRQIFGSDESLQEYFYSFTTLITPSIISLYSYSMFVNIWTSKKSHCQSRCGLATLRWLILITLQGCKYAKRNTRFFNIKICLNLSKTRQRYMYLINHFSNERMQNRDKLIQEDISQVFIPHYLFCISDCMKILFFTFSWMHTSAYFIYTSI